MQQPARKRGRPRLRSFTPDPIADAEKVVEFFAMRLEQAEERLGALIDERDKREALRRGVAPEG